ncbi:MAG TPA: M20/M25/M40 family metallo-hydrolase [Burkholderiaceae bacterium]|nr:M20/M25/M40 family metallo-hydrolase [Burkholderiaceae bacterium]
MKSPHRRLALAAAVALLTPLFVAAQTRTPVPVAADIDAAYTKLTAAPLVKKVLDDLKADDARTQRELRVLTEIEAPPFKERERAEYILSRMKALGLDATMDSEGNVVGLRKGSGRGPTLLISAHLDTVFPPGTDVKVKEKDGKWYAPGIADDTRGLAVLLAWLKTLNENKVQTVGDLLFVANVGEEGLGDLRGMKVVFKNHPGIDGMVGLEPSPVNSITTIGTASHRYEVRFTGPGGHSFEAFGTASAIHAMGRAIAKIGEITTPGEPKTTFTVGTVGGGTSVNTIAGDARMAIDIRSNGMAELLAAEKKILATLDEAVAEENKRWGATDAAKKISYTTKVIGDRPGGETAPSARIVQAAVRSIVGAGKGPATLSGSSTDANVPMSLGIPAIIIGGGGESSGWHTRDEWYNPANAWEGAQVSLVTVLGLVGVKDVVEPVLEKRPVKP